MLERDLLPVSSSALFYTGWPMAFNLLLLIDAGSNDDFFVFKTMLLSFTALWCGQFFFC
jgi:hypothetical protein